MKAVTQNGNADCHSSRGGQDQNVEKREELTLA